MTAILGKSEWSRPEQHRDLAQDLTAASRSLAFLFASGATLALASLLLPHSPRTDETGILVTLTIAYVVATALKLGPKSRAGRMLPALVACGTVLITAAVYFSDSDNVSYAFLYIWISLYASYFLSRRELVFEVLLVAVAYAAVLLAQDSTGADMERWLIAVGTVVVATVLIWRLRTQVERLIACVEAAARCDPLTGLMNRRGFHEVIELELERARRNGRSLTLICADLDHFKQINDRLGHHAGDEVLTRVAAALKSSLRRIDVVARMGGEEFALLVPDADANGAHMLAERVRAEVQRAFAGDPVPLTVSLGIATFPTDAPTEDRLLRVADEALYAAKRLGRNRSVIYSADLAGEAGLGERERHCDDGSDTVRAI